MVRLFIRPPCVRASVWSADSFSSLYAAFTCAHQRIVNIMKLYTQSNNIQVELIRLRNKDRLYSHLRLRLRTDEVNATRVITLE